jgi:hypothetical protein
VCSGGAAAVVCVVIVVVKKVMGYRLWVTGYGLWVMGYGLWVVGYGLWVVGYGVRRLAAGAPLKENCFYRRWFSIFFVSLQSLTNQKHTEI